MKRYFALGHKTVVVNKTPTISNKYTDGDDSFSFFFL